MSPLISGYGLESEILSTQGNIHNFVKNKKQFYHCQSHRGCKIQRQVEDISRNNFCNPYILLRSNAIVILQSCNDNT
jgi:hypothetical protein